MVSADRLAPTGGNSDTGRGVTRTEAVGPTGRTHRNNNTRWTGSGPLSDRRAKKA
jgi:hypothetical protein